MKAIIYEQYGPPEVLQEKEVETPIPGPGEVLIKVYATSVTKYDTWVRSLTAPPGFKFLMRLASGRKPKQPILGTECSGTIEAVGPGITRFKEGDAVFAFSGMLLGACAQYIVLPEASVVKKPENTTHAQAAVVLQGALTARFLLEKANIQPGQKVLIFGASGCVGGYAVQLAKHLYQADVTGVCSGTKSKHVLGLGADRVIDYKKEDCTKNGVHYDVVFDTVGKTKVLKTKMVLKKDGYYLFATFGLSMLLQMLWLSTTTKLNLFFGTLSETMHDLVTIKDLIEKGTIKPDLDRVFPYTQAVQAHTYVESGTKVGNVALRFVD